ncbi:MAG: hypothetical protein EP329_08695 [Deltaproteobacteria bacterium]|nr:MAG: hypothetical protein EP329_08695 [Deltaproteobacteria bacterium]
MACIRNLCVTLVLLLGLAPGVAARSPDVLIVHDGLSSEAVAAAVTAAGGVVTHVFDNAPVTAARVDSAFALSGAAIYEDAVVTIPGGADPHGFGPVTLATAPDAVLTGADLGAVDPANAANYLYTGAAYVWDVTAMGTGAVVAVVDTGVAPTSCIAHAVTGAPGFPDGYNATDDGIPATSFDNHFHGTSVANVIASYCGLCFPVGTVPHYAAAVSGLPLVPDACGPGVDLLNLLGVAPLAQIYPVKVLRAGSGDGTLSDIFAGLDHVLTLVRTGALDVRVVNLSLGFATMQDRGDVSDRFLRAFADAGVLVVAAAGNSGPKPNSVAAPATALDSLAVAAADFAPSSRFFYEYYGLTFGYAGMGLVMRPTDETRIANFSSRGPTSDGRSGPDLAAHGSWSFTQDINGDFGWGSGTSAASPAVAGGAALLVGYALANGLPIDPADLREALLAGANPTAVGESWRGLTTQGAGLLDVPASLDALVMGTASGYDETIHVGVLAPNVLGTPRAGDTRIEELEPTTLAPGETRDVVVAIGDVTSQVVFQLDAVDTPDNSAWSFVPNTLEIHVQGAERTALPSTFSIYYASYTYGPTVRLDVLDGQWIASTPFGASLLVEQPMQPGLLKLTLAADYTNESPVSFQLTVARADDAPPPAGEVVLDNVRVPQWGQVIAAVEVPPDTAVATFDLDWTRKWDRFPTTDLDLYLIDPTTGAPSGPTGATFAAPERVMVYDPAPGVWYAVLVGYEVPLPTRATLRATFE